jgi:hypothetical protein
MLKEICDFILSHAASGEGFILGDNFFAGHLPMKNQAGAEVPVRAMVILETAGSAVIGDLPDYVDKAIQVWNRNDNYFEARQDAQAIFDVLHGFTGHVLLGISSHIAYYALVIDAMATPFPIANPDEKGAFQFSANYLFRIEGEPPSP